MPTVLVIGPYRFFFFAADHVEPPHVHVEREDCAAKFWLNPVRLERSGGFSSREIMKIGHLVAQNASLLREKWDEYFNS